MTENSPAPGVPQTSTKALIATGLSAVAVFVAAWVADTDPFTAKEAATAGISALTAAGLIGGTVRAVRNRAV